VSLRDAITSPAATLIATPAVHTGRIVVRHHRRRAIAGRTIATAAPRTHLEIGLIDA
jgi:hypothetical protein